MFRCMKNKQLNVLLGLMLMTSVWISSPQVEAAGAITKAEAVEIAKKKAGGGRVLKVKPSANGKGFEVKILKKDGKVKTVFVNK